MGEAIVYYKKALRISPGNAKAHINLGNVLLHENRVDEAIDHYQMALRINPNSAGARFNLGSALLKMGRVGEAMDQYREALRINPDSVDVLNNLAWLLATSSDGHLRDGVQAVNYAVRACELTHYEAGSFVSTLAAAYAEAGRYDDAIAAGEKASALASVAGEREELENNQKRLALYRAHQPYHEAAETVFPAAP
jgi:tetratricopeptide (TPR) repeat protein